MSSATLNPLATTPTPDPLAELRDIHLPEAVSAWPPAPGWWILVASIILLAVASCITYHYYKRSALKRTALNELSTIAQHYHDQPQQLLQQLSQLLRRVALATHSRKTVAGLNDQCWLTFLDQFVSGAQFSQGDGQLLAQGPYQTMPPNFDAQALIKLSHHCIVGLFKGKKNV